MLKRTVRKLRRIIKWIPILWYDEDWDYFYIYTILQKKLQLTRKYMLQQDKHADSKHVASRIQIAIDLIEKIKTEAYLDEFFEMHDSGKYSREQLDRVLNKHDKAKSLLFKFLNHNLHHWWD